MNNKHSIGDSVVIKFSFPQIGDEGMMGIVTKIIARQRGDYGYQVLWSNGVVSPDVHENNITTVYLDEMGEQVKKWLDYYDSNN
jgi:hypothetical protein